jgi:general secretion pathway protein L
MEFREHELNLKVKPETVDPASFNQLKTALSARNTSLQETAPGTWKIRSTGAK